jgi:hypothetical protein
MRRSPRRTSSHDRPDSGLFASLWAARFKLIDVTDGLIYAACLQGVRADLKQIIFGAAREVKRSHSLTPRGRKFKSFSDTGKYAAAGNTARVSLVNRCT